MRHNGSRRRGVFPRAGLVNTERPTPYRARPGPAVAERRRKRPPTVARRCSRRSRCGRSAGSCLPEAYLNISAWVWIVTLVAVLAVLAVDLLIIGRRPHEPSMTESSGWVAFYVALALAFGAGIWFFAGGQYAAEFYTGWLTEYSLSVDNLFIFMIIMARFAVPRPLQQKVLLIGIVLALVMRGAFIAAGAALISQFSWVFYIFGAFLVYTAITLLKEGENDEDDFKENVLIRWAKRALPVSSSFGDGKMMVLADTGKRLFTPMLIVMIAIGTTDLLFALDSIPAIFGITKEPYLVFTANVFALMGLRQLFFLLGGLLERLVFLNYGLAAVLAFIGAKLFF